MDAAQIVCSIESSHKSSSLSPSLTLTLVAKSVGAWSVRARRTASSRSCNLRRLSRKSVLELRLGKLIITTLIGLLVVFVVVLVSVALESVHSRSASTSVRRRNEAYSTGVSHCRACGPCTSIAALVPQPQRAAARRSLRASLCHAKTQLVSC